jgi:hypothetical protein
MPRTPIQATAESPRYCTVAEACRIGCFSKARLYELIGIGQVQAVKDGRKTLVDLDTVRARQANLPKTTIKPHGRMAAPIA